MIAVLLLLPRGSRGGDYMGAESPNWRVVQRDPPLSAQTSTTTSFSVHNDCAEFLRKGIYVSPSLPF